MGEPRKVGGRHKRYTRTGNKQVFDRNMDTAGMGTHHKNGLSSQNGRTTIIYRDGKRILVRERDKVLRPDELGSVGRKRGQSVYDMLEKTGRVSHA